MKEWMKIWLVIGAVILPVFVGWSLRHTQAPAAPFEWHRYARDRYQDVRGNICGQQSVVLWWPDDGCVAGERRYVFTEHIMTHGGSETDTLLKQGWVAE